MTDYEYAVEWTNENGSLVVPATLQDARKTARDYEHANAVRRPIGPWEPVPPLVEGDTADSEAEREERDAEPADPETRAGVPDSGDHAEDH